MTTDAGYADPVGDAVATQHDDQAEVYVVCGQCHATGTLADISRWKVLAGRLCHIRREPGRFRLCGPARRLGGRS